MGIIKDFKSYFKKDTNSEISSFYWFDEQFKYMKDRGYEFVGDEESKVGSFKKGSTEVKKVAYSPNSGQEDYYFIVVKDNIKKRYENFYDLKKAIR